jgi:hypothetical protein
MTFRSCPREPELSDLLGRGQWPEACGEELRLHVNGCRVCRELVLVKQAFGLERMKASGEARLESPGLLWWRAQLRRRNAAIERIGRPLLGAQVFALVTCLAAAAAYILWMAHRGFDWLAWLASLPGALHLGVLLPDSWGLWTAMTISAMVALMCGVIAYLVSEKG